MNVHPLRASILKEVIWNPPITNRMKCKTDGASICRASSWVGIFRNNEFEFLRGFEENLGGGAAYFAESFGVMKATEIASNKNWRNLWLEIDSTQVFWFDTLEPKKQLVQLQDPC